MGTNYIGVDIEKNRRGVWNLGLGLFSGRSMVQGFNVFIEEFFSEDVSDGYGAAYFKTRRTINKARSGVWVKTLKEADTLAEAILNGWKARATFGYNSVKFDLPILAEAMPKVSVKLATIEHVDVMPLAVHYLTGRKSYKEFWKNAASLDLAEMGNPEYRKFGAELVLNYLLYQKARKKKEGFIYKKEEHIGLEDLYQFEYPLFYYFKNILKQKRRGLEVSTSFLKWPDV